MDTTRQREEPENGSGTSIYRSSGRRVNRVASGETGTSPERDISGKGSGDIRRDRGPRGKPAGARPLGSRKDRESPHTFSLRMSVALRVEIAAQAEREGVSVSEWVRRACERSLQDGGEAR